MWRRKMLSDLIKSCFLVSCHQNHLKFGTCIHCIMPHTIGVISSRNIISFCVFFQCFYLKNMACENVEDPIKSCFQSSSYQNLFTFDTSHGFIVSCTSICGNIYYYFLHFSDFFSSMCT